MVLKDTVAVFRAILAGSALAVFMLAGCSDDKGLNRLDDELSGEAFIFLTDYQSAALAKFQSADTSVATVPFPSLHTDVALRSYGDMLYVIERFGRDAISVLSPQAPSAPLASYSVGNGTNPQDIVVRDAATAYVLRLGSANVLIVNPTTGDSLGAISIAAYADADGKPEMVAGLLDGGRLYVLVQLLDTASSPYFWVPTGPGKLLVIDLGTKQVLSTITLTIENPQAMARAGDVLYVVGGPYDDLGKAGIDRVRIPDGHAANVATGTALGGRPTAIELDADRGDAAWVLVAKDWPNATVYAVSLPSGVVADSLAGAVSPSAIARGAGDVLLVSDRDMVHPGLYVYDAVTGARLKGPIATSLPPDAIAFIRK